MDPRYKLYAEFTRALVSALTNADLKQEIAYGAVHKGRPQKTDRF